MSPLQQLSGVLFDVLNSALTGLISSFVGLLFQSLLTPLLNSIATALGLGGA
ncbi:MAG: hypothetical protein ACE5F9_09755 [Phycisphaerae bacterium]